MKSPPFAYHAPETLEEAIASLADPDAKVLAGGQSLLPVLALRLAHPSLLIDLARIEELRFIEVGSRSVKIGAMTTQRDVERSTIIAERLPLLHAAVKQIAHPAIRNRGTIGGSLVHADPAAELPVVMLALEASLVVQGPNGSRTIDAADFWSGPFTCSIGSDEILVQVEIPLRVGRWSFVEVARRPGDFALAMAAVGLDRQDGGRCSWARIVLGGVARTPVRAAAAEDVLVGEAIDEDSTERAAAVAMEGLAPASDVHGSSAYRRRLAGVLVKRAIMEVT